MLARRSCYSVCVVGCALLFLLSACMGEKAPPKSALEVLQSSATTMKQLKSVHFTMDTETTESTSNTGTNAQPIKINLKDTGKQVFPDQVEMRLDIAVGTGKQPFSISQVVTGQKMYIQNAGGKWFVLEERALKDTAGNPFATANISKYSNLLSLAQKAKLDDHGTESINEQSLRHITATFGNDALKEIMAATGQLEALPPQQREKLDALLKNKKTDQPTLNVWIDEDTSYVHRLALHITINIDMGAMTSSKPANGKASVTMSKAVNTTINYSKFNESVTIKAPNNPTPAKDFAQIFKEH